MNIRSLVRAKLSISESFNTPNAVERKMCSLCLPQLFLDEHGYQLHDGPDNERGIHHR